MNLTRDQAVSHIRSIRVLRNMLTIAYNPRLSRNDAGDVAHALTLDIREKLKACRKALRLEQSPKTFMEKTMDRIRRSTNSAISSLMDRHSRTRWDVEIGGKPKAKMNLSKLELRLGWRWHDKVYLKLIKDRLLKGNNLLILDAVEYKTNAHMIKIYTATAWDLREKKEKKGYIGQSKYSGKTVFRLTAHDAIKAAQSATVASVNDKLGLEK